MENAVVRSGSLERSLEDVGGLDKDGGHGTNRTKEISGHRTW